MRTWPALIIAFPDAGAVARQEPVPLRDRVSLALDDLDVTAILEEPDGSWLVTFRNGSQRGAALAGLAASAAAGLVTLRAIDVDDEDWASRSQSSLRAVRVGRIVVAPPWDVESPRGDSVGVRIVIEPAMGFGSGHHATTRLCLEALQRLDVGGRRVLDVGTGSGVLALAASCLGASSVLAIDVDPDALDNARANATLNGNPRAVEFRQQDFREGSTPAADLVLANLTGAMLAANVQSLTRLVAPGGALVVSGLTAAERGDVMAAFAEGFDAEWTGAEDGWCCALLRSAR